MYLKFLVLIALGISTIFHSETSGGTVTKPAAMQENDM